MLPLKPAQQSASIQSIKSNQIKSVTHLDEAAEKRDSTRLDSVEVDSFSLFILNHHIYLYKYLQYIIYQHEQ